MDTIVTTTSPQLPMTGASQDRFLYRISHGEFDTVIVCFPDAQGRLVGKHLTANYFLANQGSPIGVCNYLLALDLDLTPLSGFDHSSWERGYGDMMMVPDDATWRVVPWAERTAMVLCDLTDKRGAPIEVAPRTILKRQLERLAVRGFKADFASELEFYTFSSNYGDARRQGYLGMKAAGWFPGDYQVSSLYRDEGLMKAIRENMGTAGIRVESSKGEWEPGQVEVNLGHTEAMRMADDHVIFKQGVKEIASTRERSVSFMAKWDAQQAGSGCHIHMSLWGGSENSEPVFVGQDGMSLLMKQFLAGQLYLSRDMTLLLAPYVNSYKRFQPSSFAPTRIGWATDNRTYGFRVVGSGAALRIECRIPGADTNPYLAYSALIAAGLHGIEQHLVLPRESAGNGYQADKLPSIPTCLDEAIAALDESSTLRRLLGDAVLSHYLCLARREADEYAHAVTDWERQRYFERV